MKSFATRLRALRKEKELTQLELADQFNISKSSISMYEARSRMPEYETLEAIADYFKVNLDYLVGKSDIRNYSEDLYNLANISPIEKKKFPLLESVADGKLIMAEKNFEGYFKVDEDIKADFCLKAKGDSMINVRIMDGDIVFIQKQDIVGNGEIAAVLIEEEVTLKRYYLNDGIIHLIAENPAIPPRIYKKEELSRIRIIGKAIAFQSDVK